MKRVVCFFVLCVTLFMGAQCKSAPFAHTLCDMVANASRDIIQLNINLFSVDSARITTASIPWFIASNFADKRVHSVFYDADQHRNCHSPSSTVSKSIGHCAFWGMVFLSSFSLYSRDAQLRMVSYIFALGAISGLLAKDVIKQIHVKGSVRPRNQWFDSNVQCYNGWPSGHMFEASYMATVFGTHYGLKAFVPLGAFAGAMFAVSVADNRHFVSQLVAGTALGVVYGVAAHSLIDRRLFERYHCVMGYEQRTGLGCGIRVDF